MIDSHIIIGGGSVFQHRSLVSIDVQLQSAEKREENELVFSVDYKDDLIIKFDAFCHTHQITSIHVQNLLLGKMFDVIIKKFEVYLTVEFENLQAMKNESILLDAKADLTNPQHIFCATAAAAAGGGGGGTKYDDSCAVTIQNVLRSLWSGFFKEWLVVHLQGQQPASTDEASSLLDGNVVFIIEVKEEMGMGNVIKGLINSLSINHNSKLVNFQWVITLLYWNKNIYLIGARTITSPHFRAPLI